MHFNRILTHRRKQGLSFSHFPGFLFETPKGRSKPTTLHRLCPSKEDENPYPCTSAMCNTAVILQAADTLITATEEKLVVWDRGRNSHFLCNTAFSSMSTTQIAGKVPSGALM